MCFARANLFVLSYTFMLKSFPDRKSPLFKLRLLEIVGIAFFWTWFGAVLRAIPGPGTRVLYLLISFAVTSPLHVQVGGLLYLAQGFPRAPATHAVFSLLIDTDRPVPFLSARIRHLRRRAAQRVTRVSRAPSTPHHDGHRLPDLSRLSPRWTQFPNAPPPVPSHPSIPLPSSRART